jgi:hypothetical protein
MPDTWDPYRSTELWFKIDMSKNVKNK